ncbi:hypothetical protein PR048_019845 [Dryococelus australis]|uniref:Uncharacterized protein n=1 Tax=Dryococelus australis TaxID=614101 RepID=A0ABQ9H4M0_9NEOP|nr:hypothetical protein PR048_019845 [Dryococelus australis]
MAVACGRRRSQALKCRYSNTSRCKTASTALVRVACVRILYHTQFPVLEIPVQQMFAYEFAARANYTREQASNRLLPAPQTVDVHFGDLQENLKLFKFQSENYSIAMGLDKNEETVKVARVKEDRVQPRGQGVRITQCFYCGGSHVHKKELCLAYGKRCRVCNRLNHFTLVCKQQENQQDGKICRLDERPIEGALSTNTKKKWITDLDMGDQGHMIKVQLDTGTTCDVMSFKDYRAIVGREHTKDTIMSRYPDLFKGIECLSVKHLLEIDTGAKPVQQPPRRYPIVLRPKVKEKLA